MTVKLFLHLVSQPCRAIVLFAKLNNIPYEHREVALLDGETRTEAYKKINPLGGVPVLQDGDLTLTESFAILHYLAQKFSVPDHWYPTDLVQRARVDEFVLWLFCPGGLRQSASSVFLEHTLFPMKRGQPADPAVVKQKKEALDPVVQKLEDHFLSRGDYIAGGSEPTVADLLAVCELFQLSPTGYDVTEGRPRIAAWLKRLIARLQGRYQEVNQFFTDMFLK